MTKPRVVIADHRLVAAGLAQLLAPSCDVVSMVHDGATLLEEVRRLGPDVVVQEVSLPPPSGLGLIREILRIDPGIRIIVVAMWEDPDLAEAAFRAGASAYIAKNCATSELLKAVRCTVAQKSYVTGLIAGGMIRALAQRAKSDESGYQLTTRQREVLRLLAEGKAMKEAAAALNLTVRTIAFHKYRMMHQLQIKSSAELVRFAISQHIA